MARKLVVEILGDTSGLERSFARASRSTKGFEHDIGRASRGALSAAVSFKGLGRAMAFSSAQFLGGAGIVFALKSTIQAAEESQRVLGQTSVAVSRAGLSWATYGKQVEAAALKLSNLSGFDDEALLGTFSKLVRATGNVNEALTDNALAANIARGANIDLEKAATIVLRASQGQARGLANIGISARKGASSVELLALLNQKFSGSAVAFGRTAVGAQERFRVAIENTQEALGKGALPALTKYLNKGSDWLSQSKNQARIQRDVTEAVHVLGGAVQVAGTVVKDAAAVFKTFSGLVGGSKHALELLAAVAAGFKVVKILEGLSGIGGAAKAARTEVGLLRGSLLGLGRLGAIAIPVTVALSAKWLSESDFGKKLGLDFSGLDLANAISHGLGGGHLVSAADVKTLLAGGATPIEIAQKFGSFIDDAGAAALKKAAEAASLRAQKAAAASAKVNLFSGNVPTFATGPLFEPPKPAPGAGHLSPFAQATLDLSTAALTDTTADNLKALNTQRELLAKKIDVETARLKNAPTAKAAQKFATELERLNGLQVSVISEIASLQKKAAGKTPNELATQRNSFFDSAISRALDRVQDIPSIQGQISTLQAIAAKIGERIAVTKDVTRKLTLEADQAEVFRTIKADQAQVGQDILDALSFNVTKAEATAGFSDDFAALDAALAGIRARMVKEGQTAALLQEEFAATQAIKAKRAEAGAAFLDALSFNVDRAAVSGSFAKQFAANTAYQQGIKTLIAQEGATLDLQRQLFDAQQNRIAIAQTQAQQIAERRAAAEAAAQAARQAAQAAWEKALAASEAAAAKAKDAATRARQGILDRLSFGVTKANVTASFKDDLATNEALRAAILVQIRGGHKTLALEEQLFAVNQTIAQTRVKARDALQAARDAAQFKTLGLGPTGGELPATFGDLKKHLGTVEAAIKGTFLDTPKTRSIFAHIRQVFKGGMKGVSSDVLQAIDTMLSGIDDKLKSHAGDQTKFRHTTAGKVFAGLDLTVEQKRALRGRIGQIGPGGTIPQRTSQFSAAGGGSGMTVHIEHFHSSAENPRQLEDELEKRARSRAVTRRGA